jgi:esterase/lipase superfamily enzyme
MELRTYGEGGRPVLVFPCQDGRFYEFEDFGMLPVVERFLSERRYVFITVDSLDAESWANRAAHPADRARRHEDYDRYICSEVVPFMSSICGGRKPVTYGCSMGGYHAGNFFLRHPDLFGGMISLSGLFSLDYFVGDYMDELVYFNSPLHYLPRLEDGWYLDRIRKGSIIVCVGQGSWEDTMLAHARALDAVLTAKHIPHWVDIWGHDVNHDWPWWRIQLPYFLDRIPPE